MSAASTVSNGVASPVRRFLRDIADAARRAACRADPPSGSSSPAIDAHHRRLARAVAPDQPDAAARRQRRGRAVEDRAPAEAHGDAVEVEHARAVSRCSMIARGGGRAHPKRQRCRARICLGRNEVLRARMKRPVRARTVVCPAITRAIVRAHHRSERPPVDRIRPEKLAQRSARVDRRRRSSRCRCASASRSPPARRCSRADRGDRRRHRRRHRCRNRRCRSAAPPPA